MAASSRKLIWTEREKLALIFGFELIENLILYAFLKSNSKLSSWSILFQCHPEKIQFQLTRYSYISKCKKNNYGNEWKNFKDEKRNKTDRKVDWYIEVEECIPTLVESKIISAWLSRVIACPEFLRHL